MNQCSKRDFLQGLETGLSSCVDTLTLPASLAYLVKISASNVCQDGFCGSLIDNFRYHYSGTPFIVFSIGGLIGCCLSLQLSSSNWRRCSFTLFSVILVLAGEFIYQATDLFNTMLGVLVMGLGSGGLTMLPLSDRRGCTDIMSLAIMLVGKTCAGLLFTPFAVGYLLTVSSIRPIVGILLIILSSIMRYIWSDVFTDSEVKLYDFDEEKWYVGIRKITLDTQQRGPLNNIIAMCVALIFTGGIANTAYRASVTGELTYSGLNVYKVAVFMGLALVGSCIFVILGSKRISQTTIGSAVMVLSSVASALVCFGYVSGLEVFTKIAFFGIIFSYFGLVIQYRREISSLEPEYAVPTAILSILAIWFLILIVSSLFPIIHTALGNYSFIVFGAGPLLTAQKYANISLSDILKGN